MFFYKAFNVRKLGTTQYYTCHTLSF
ncbi:protein of unknown function [Sterolibacterium denitrificans]|uniref:Uncharacterized protein n=1 Tax=Sterolibacterium denitrificans TaxID=157592 RepID=A0A7Z7HQ26_9PROT|nr:protein of unknown function [Sterolibacterium denitrificans]